MPFLEELILAGNPITALPIDFLAMLGRYMVRLRYLDLDRIKVGEYPGNIHRCIPSLQEFHMSEIDLTGKGVYVPLTIDEPITGNFKVLELRKNGITSLPAKFRALWTLTKLDLSGNTFPTFPVVRYCLLIILCEAGFSNESY
jgi:Leucine-rich repeat (LRR) protein